MFEEYNDIVTVPEMSQMLLIGINNTYKLLENGEVKGFRNGRNWRVSKRAIEEFIIRASGLKNELKNDKSPRQNIV